MALMMIREPAVRYAPLSEVIADKNGISDLAAAQDIVKSSWTVSLTRGSPWPAVRSVA